MTGPPTTEEEALDGSQRKRRPDRGTLVTTRDGSVLVCVECGREQAADERGFVVPT